MFISKNVWINFAVIRSTLPSEPHVCDSINRRLINSNIKPGDNSQNLCKFNHFKPNLICGCIKCGQNIIMLKGNIFRSTNVNQIQWSACFTKEMIASLAETLSRSEVSTSIKRQVDSPLHTAYSVAGVWSGRKVASLSAIRHIYIFSGFFT